AGLEAYGRRDAAGALAALDRAEVPAAYRPLRDLFRASALLIENRPAEARELLESLSLRAMPEPWRDRASWLLYAALHRTGDTDRAAELLDELTGLPGEIGELARAERGRQSPGPKSTNPAQ
ncbi:MAG TPA: hypothetical protein VJS92_17300, partial [Candidatus Polarisedimenticolaceae bacterium]|nr:hypothetical protein [Candidatus Polarisedimenticolaceae bacterium]